MIPKLNKIIFKGIAIALVWTVLGDTKFSSSAQGISRVVRIAAAAAAAAAVFL